MFFLKKKYFKFKERYDSIRVRFVMPDDLSDIPDNEGFFIKINTIPYAYGEITATYGLQNKTFIDRPITFGKLVDLLEEALASSAETSGFQVKLPLIKYVNQDPVTVGHIRFAIVYEGINTYLSDIKYENNTGKIYECSNLSNTPYTGNIFFGKNMNYIGDLDIANILLTEDYFDLDNPKIQLAIANLKLWCTGAPMP